jgi:hypothetical protein
VPKGTEIVEIGTLIWLIGRSHAAVLTSDGADGHADQFEPHTPTNIGIRPCGTDLCSTARDLECVTSWVSVHAVAQVAGIIGTLDCSVQRDAPMVVVAVANVDKDGRSHASHLEVHTPASVMIQTSSADLPTISCDLELVVGLVGVDPVAQMACVTCAHHGIWSINAFFVLIAVVDQDMDWISRHNLTREFFMAGCDASDLEMHAPTTAGVGPHSAHLVARGGDVEGVTSLM